MRIRSTLTTLRMTGLVLTMLFLVVGNIHLHSTVASVAVSSHPLTMAAASGIAGGNAIVRGVSGVACGIGVIGVLAFPPAGALLWGVAGSGLAVACVAAFLG